MQGCNSARGQRGTWRDTGDAEGPMAVAEAIGEFAIGNKSQGSEGDLYSWLALFWDTVALPNWKVVFYCVVGFIFF